MSSKTKRNAARGALFALCVIANKHTISAAKKPLLKYQRNLPSAFCPFSALRSDCSSFLPNPLCIALLLSLCVDPSAILRGSWKVGRGPIAPLAKGAQCAALSFALSHSLLS